jgi:predicted O-linked N-acetylglucosamine transferase (SPINDLY family)
MAARPDATEDPARALLRDARRALAAGNPHQASAAARRLAKLRPRDRDALNACAWIAHQAGEARAAERFLEQSLAVDPTQVEALSNLASLYQAGERFEAALALLDRAVAQDAGLASLHYNRGNALKALGRLAEAEQAFRAALARARDGAPETAAFNANLANTLVAAGRLDDAVEPYRRSLALRPDHVDTLRHLVTTLRQLWRLDAAAAALAALQARDPGSAETLAVQGALQRDRGDLDGAIATLRAAIAADPALPAPHFELGSLLYQLDAPRIGEAIDCFRAAVERMPAFAEAHYALGKALFEQGRLDAGIAAHERALALAPERADYASGLLFPLQYLPDLAPAELTRRHLELAGRHAEPLRPTLPDAAAPHVNPPDPARRLRVGYVSPDFRWHAVSDFLAPLIRAHDRAAVEIACYADVPKPDRRTAEFQTMADLWRTTVSLGDAQLAAQIRDDGIDILVDLAGHTGKHRLGVFARKPAPVQISWLGYAGTTGVRAIDYRFTDAIADPAPDADALACERLIRLPHGFLTYAPRQDSPPIGPPPSATAGVVTFGSFNNLAKVNDRVVACWARLLADVPDSRLLLKFYQLGDAPTRQAHLDRLIAAGIAPERVTLEPGIPNWTAHMARYDAVDVALDPFPYNGTTTTCEALWMGVPVITLAGDRHAGRVGASLLTRVGLDDLITRDVDDYVAKAAALAADAARRAALRASLRARFIASPLGDARAFARDVEAAYREVWRAWCAGRATEERR